MSEGAKVDSIDALKVFRISLIKFGDAINIALGDAEAELHRVQMWLDNEQPQHWTSQIRKRQEVLGRAMEALRMKKVYKDSSGGQQSSIDEEKAVNKCKKLLEEAEAKLVACKQWSRKFQKEAANYKGATQRLMSFALADVPVAAAKLDRMTAILQAYVDLKVPMPTVTSSGSGESVTQAPPTEHAADGAAAPAEAEPTAPAGVEAAASESGTAEAAKHDPEPAVPGAASSQAEQPA